MSEVSNLYDSLSKYSVATGIPHDEVNTYAYQYINYPYVFVVSYDNGATFYIYASIDTDLPVTSGKLVDALNNSIGGNYVLNNVRVIGYQLQDYPSLTVDPSTVAATQQHVNVLQQLQEYLHTHIIYDSIAYNDLRKHPYVANYPYSIWISSDGGAYYSMYAFHDPALINYINDFITYSYNNNMLTEDQINRLVRTDGFVINSFPDTAKYTFIQPNTTEVQYYTNPGNYYNVNY